LYWFFLAFLVFSKNELFSKFYQDGLLAPVFVVIIYPVPLSKRRVIQLFADRRVEYLDEISYGINILQFPVSILVFAIIDRTMKTSPTTSFYIYLISLIMIASMTFHLIEKPFKLIIRNSLVKKVTV
jgi:peptidoglycan/LPS O-acetylase OafA/YrhL